MLNFIRAGKEELFSFFFRLDGMWQLENVENFAGERAIRQTKGKNPGSCIRGYARNAWRYGGLCLIRVFVRCSRRMSLLVLFSLRGAFNYVDNL